MLSGKRDTKTLERAFSPKIEPPNSYTLKSGQLEWFQCDVNSRGSKNEPIKLVRASDEGLLLQMPAHSTHPDSPLYHTFELKADNIGSMPIVKHCSNSVIQSRYKKGLLICKKNSNNSWSSLVLCQREDKLNPDTDPEKWRDTIVKELFAQKEYKSDFMLMCGADKYTVHCTEKFVSLVPNHRPFKKRDQLIEYCLRVKEYIWSRQNFHRACKQSGLSSFSVKDLSGRETTFRIISNRDIDLTVHDLKDYVQEPSDVIHCIMDPFSKRQPYDFGSRPLPIIPPNETQPIVYGSQECSPVRLDSPPPNTLPEDWLNKKVQPSEGHLEALPEESELIYLNCVKLIPRATKVKQIERADQIKSSPYSQRLTRLVQPIPKWSNRKGGIFDIDIDEKFQSTNDCHGFKDVLPRDGVKIERNKSIDSTLYNILKEVRRGGRLESMESCDIGLGKNRIQFVFRLEYLTEGKWKDFAYEVFGDLLSDDDLRLIEEFACTMAMTTVQILLIHWKRLSDINDPSLGVKKACVEVIEQILTKLDLLDILDIVKSANTN